MAAVESENAPAVVSEPRASSQEDQIDLDYDEESCHGGSVDQQKSADEEKSPPPVEAEEELEEGELEEGELSSSDDDEPPAPAAVSRKPPPPQNNDKRPISNRSPPTRARKEVAENSWEKALREAREAMKRANKVREEPDFETKRLVAVPALRRSSRNNTDSDHSNSPGPRRRHGSRSQSPRGGRIPSLMDIRTSPPQPPRRIPPKAGRPLSPLLEPGHRHLPPIQRRSPSYASRSRSRSRSQQPPALPPPLPPRPVSHQFGYKLTKAGKRIYTLGYDLGPQVLYPSGRPCPKREPSDRNRPEPPRRREASPPRTARGRRDSPRKKETSRPEKRDSLEGKKKIKKLTVVDTSPISSDSDSFGSKKMTKKGGAGDLSAVNDPWARRKGQAEKKRRGRSSSSSSTGSDSSRSTFPGRKKRDSRSSSGSSGSSSSSDSSDSEEERRKKSSSKQKKKSLSPPRGDISHYRIPKKKSRPQQSSADDPVEAFFAKKKSDLPAAFRKRSKRSSSPEEEEEAAAAAEATAKRVKMEDISASDSDEGSKRRRSSRSSSRSPPLKYRQKEKSPSPISDDEDEEEEVPPPPESPKAPTESQGDAEGRKRRQADLLKQLKTIDEELDRRRNGTIVETAH